MPAMVKRVAFAVAVAIAIAAIPAWSTEMPDFGTKNFSPGSAAPAYFSNEKGAALGQMDATDDGSDVSAGGAAQSSVEPGNRGWSGAGHYRLAARRSGSHREPHLGMSHHSPRTASASRPRARRPAGTRHPAHYAAVGGTAAGAGQTRTAKAVKSNLRHASTRFSLHKG
jgi:hypothetical protein